MKHEITEVEYKKVVAFAKKNNDERLERKLQVLLMRYEGAKNREIAKKLNYSLTRVSELCREFKEVGLDEYVRPKYKANRRNLSREKEKEILDSFYQRSASGEKITAQMIRKKLEECLGRKTNEKYVYDVLSRHGWKDITTLRSRNSTKKNQ